VSDMYTHWLERYTHLLQGSIHIQMNVYIHLLKQYTH
jgi:hypothetical protein